LWDQKLEGDERNLRPFHRRQLAGDKSVCNHRTGHVLLPPVIETSAKYRRAMAVHLSQRVLMALVLVGCDGQYPHHDLR
jgi:hypothetical protein